MLIQSVILLLFDISSVVCCRLGPTWSRPNASDHNKISCSCFHLALGYGLEVVRTSAKFWEANSLNCNVCFFHFYFDVTSALFSGENFRFGNPVQKFQQELKGVCYSNLFCDLSSETLLLLQLLFPSMYLDQYQTLVKTGQHNQHAYLIFWSNR